MSPLRHGSVPFVGTHFWSPGHPSDASIRAYSVRTSAHGGRQQDKEIRTPNDDANRITEGSPEKTSPPPKANIPQPDRPQTLSQGLTHIGSDGRIAMVDTSSKPSTYRVAVAAGTVRFSNAAVPSLIATHALSKGNVLTTAHIAGVQAAKRCADLIPLCHPVPLAHVHLDLHPDEEGAKVDVVAVASTTATTGVEMEALAAVAGAALTVYDMCKAVDKGMRVEAMRVVYKRGGRSGTFVGADDEDGKIVEDLVRRGVVPPEQ